MSRWKPPQPRSSPYITPQGYRKLQDELEQLWVRRAVVTEALSAAAAEGDRSENAEYIYRKKQLREIDRRIRYLQKRLPELNVVNEVGRLREKVSAYLDRPIEQLSPVEHALLLMAASELDSQPDTPYRVVINEAVELAKAYGGTDGHKYVNGVLDKLAPELRPGEAAARRSKA